MAIKLKGFVLAALTFFAAIPAFAQEESAFDSLMGK